MNAPAQRFLETPDGPLAYAEAGPPGAGPLLLVHGGFGAANHWRRNQPAFAGKFRTLAPDLPGFGESYLPPRPHTARSVTEGIGRLLDGLGIDRCPCVAFSFGATMLATYCQEPEAAGRIGRAVLLGPGGFGLSGDAPLGGERRARRDMTPEEKHAVFIHNQKAIMFKDPACVDEEYLALAEANLARSRMNIYAMNRAPYLPDLLPAMTMPLLILWGDADVALHPSKEERLAACRAAAPHAETDFVPGAGHMAQWEQAEWFNRRVLRFLEGGPSPA